MKARIQANYQGKGSPQLLESFPEKRSDEQNNFQSVHYILPCRR